MTESWRYIFTPQARRDMRRLDQVVIQRIFDALDSYVAERRGNVRKLTGRENEWRIRVGDWRILFRRDLAARTVVVLRVLPRGRAYRS